MPIYQEFRSPTGIIRVPVLASAGDKSGPKTAPSSMSVEQMNRIAGETINVKAKKAEQFRHALPSMNSAGPGKIFNK
jgi:hypothetical protein